MYMTLTVRLNINVISSSPPKLTSYLLNESIHTGNFSINHTSAYIHEFNVQNFYKSSISVNCEFKLNFLSSFYNQ